MLATFAIFVVLGAVISKALPKVYTATSALVVVQKENSATFDAVQAAQVTARTYSDIISAPAIAAKVAQKLGGGETQSSISSAVSVSPVSETQLLKITAEDHNAAKAQAIANTYASAVVEYIGQNVGPTVGANVAFASSATKPSSPSRPKPTLYVLVAAVLGLCFGVGAAFLAERLDTGLRSAEEVRERFGELILARMPRRGRTPAATSAFHEAFGLLRTNLAFASPDNPPKLIAVTSAREGEGKTTCVAQIAAAMAEVDSKVIVVDADFRRPALQKAVVSGSPSPLQPGLSNHLLGSCSLAEAIHPTDTEHVELVPTGPLPPAPAAFLESHRVEPALRELTERADLVLIDCPPMAAGADASVIAGRVDGVIVVVDLASSDERSVREVLRQLKTVRANVLGFVLNRDRAIELAYDYERARTSSTV